MNEAADVAFTQEAGMGDRITDVGVDLGVQPTQHASELPVQLPKGRVAAGRLVQHQAAGRLAQDGILESVYLVDDDHVAAAEHQLFHRHAIGHPATVVDRKVDPPGVQVGVGCYQYRRAAGCACQTELPAGGAPRAGAYRRLVPVTAAGRPQPHARLVAGPPGVDMLLRRGRGDQRAAVAELLVGPLPGRIPRWPLLGDVLCGREHRCRRHQWRRLRGRAQQGQVALHRTGQLEDVVVGRHDQRHRQPPHRCQAGDCLHQHGLAESGRRL